MEDILSTVDKMTGRNVIVVGTGGQGGPGHPNIKIGGARPPILLAQLLHFTCNYSSIVQW